MSTQRRLCICVSAVMSLALALVFSLPDKARAQSAPSALHPQLTAASAGQADEHASVVANPRAQNSWNGSSGGARLIDAASGDVGTLRLQLGMEFFRSGNFLAPDDTHQELGGTLALSATLAEFLELFASYAARSNSNDRGNPILLQVAGDISVGAKAYAQVLPWLSLGGDLRGLILNTVGDLGVTAGATSLGIRGAATADLRYASPSRVPLIIRANIGYLLDNSSQLIADVERERYAALPTASRRPLRDEERQLITRVERFGLGIDRVDLFSVGVGIEAPVELARDFYVQPLLEWQLGIPVNRQNYDCLHVATDARRENPDGCLGSVGLMASPSTVTVGARVLPPVHGLSILLAADVGVLGMRRFVRELAPNRPWAAMLALAYASETRRPEPERVYVRVPSAVPATLPVRLRGRGVVVERGNERGVIGAVVRYPEREWSPQLTGAEGSFISYAFEPGTVMLEITHPDYEPERCAMQLDPRAAVAADPTSKEQFVQVRCELSARPQTGRLAGIVQDEAAHALAGLTVEIVGPAARSFSTSASGAFSASDLPPGEYSARVDSPDYLWKTQSFGVGVGGETQLVLTLNAKPKVSQVTLTARELKIGTQVVFESGTANIDARSSALLREVASVLARNSQVAHVEVQGHTDNTGSRVYNHDLSQRRAEAVVQWLVNAGLDPSRFEAHGYGDERPLVPNLTPDNRAKNRRVQFVIKP